MATGLGLGLAFVKTVMDKHNGEIQCRSVVRQGSTFTLNFPAYADAGDLARPIATLKDGLVQYDQHLSELAGD